LNRPCGFSSFFGHVRFASAQLLSSPHFLLSGAVSPPTDIVTLPCHVTLLLFHRVKVSSLHPFNPSIMLRPVVSPSWANIEVLNLHHRRWPPSSDSPTPTHHCYKKIVSILITLPTIQPRLNFASSLTRAPRHRSFTRRHRFISPPSHVHRPST
jgi:hypothetical protein